MKEGRLAQETVALGVIDPVVLSTIVQTAVLTLTLVIFILSFRSQNKANKEAAYKSWMTIQMRSRCSLTSQS